jgi:Zn-dependent protease
VALLTIGIQMNVVLALFNLVPLPPLDGSWIASWGLPRSVSGPYDRIMEPYGQWILLILFVTGVLGRLLSPFTGVLASFLLGLAR